MLQTFIKRRKINTIRAKMLSYYLLMALLMISLSIFALRMTNRYKSQIDQMFVRNLLLNEISRQLNDVDKQLVVFLASKSSESLNSYMQNADQIKVSGDELLEEVTTYSEEELMMIDIRNMVHSYLEKANDAVSAKRKTNVEEYTKQYNASIVIKEYIMEYIGELNNRQLDKNARNYSDMVRLLQFYNMLTIFMIVDLIALSMIIVYVLTHSIIMPLTKLAKSAEEIAEGNFESEDIIVQTRDEIEILARAFNKMKNSIYEYIEKVKEKAKTEAKLKDKEMENIKMQSLLNDARLYALQSQMNPHFLFNTINAGVQLSMIEGADRTSEFLESMSRLMRYNIKQMEAVVTISQEVDNIRDYYSLLQVRFEDMIVFHFDIKSEALHYDMPPLVLQPIVENAYIHGLSKKEEGGNIYISVYDVSGYVEVVIEDDGKGMDENRVMDILSESNKLEDENIDKSNGVGLKNVIHRLELFYGQKDLFFIESKIGKGTKVIIDIPYKKEKYNV